MNPHADVDSSRFFSVLADLGCRFSFIVPTPLGYRSSMVELRGDTRYLLKFTHMEDSFSSTTTLFNDSSAAAFFITDSSVKKTKGNIYKRKVGAKEKNFIWFDGLQKYCQPYNLLALIVSQRKIYLVNLSQGKIAESLFNGHFVKRFIEELALDTTSVLEDLLEKLQEIASMGFIESIYKGSPGVGKTVQRLLGIEKKTLKAEYKGIEVKATDKFDSGNGKRVSLFSMVPSGGMSEKDILKHYGKVQTTKAKKETRLQISGTVSCDKVNPYGLFLRLDEKQDSLQLYYTSGTQEQYISSWEMEDLRYRIADKFEQTVLLFAEKQTFGDLQFFKYTKAKYTRFPNISLLENMLKEGKITLDLTVHFDQEKSKVRSHGLLFKIQLQSLGELMGFEENYSLAS